MIDASGRKFSPLKRTVCDGRLQTLAEKTASRAIANFSLIVAIAIPDIANWLPNNPRPEPGQRAWG